MIITPPTYLINLFKVDHYTWVSLTLITTYMTEAEALHKDRLKNVVLGCKMMILCT